MLYKTSKIVFSRFIFTIYDMGIHGVTRGYRGLQGVTEGYKGLQGETVGDNGLRWVTKDNRNFFLTRTFPRYLFLVYFAEKPKLKKSQIFYQIDGLTPLEKF